MLVYPGTNPSPPLQAISRGDIISFYNQAFVPAMKGFLMHQHQVALASNAAAAAEGKGKPETHTHTSTSQQPIPSPGGSRHQHRLPPLPPSVVKGSPRPQVGLETTVANTLQTHRAPTKATSWQRGSLTLKRSKVNTRLQSRFADSAALG